MVSFSASLFHLKPSDLFYYRPNFLGIDLDGSDTSSDLEDVDLDDEPALAKLHAANTKENEQMRFVDQTCADFAGLDGLNEDRNLRQALRDPRGFLKSFYGDNLEDSFACIAIVLEEINWN